MGGASKFLAVGAAVPWARIGAGALATQAWANLSYGPTGLDLLEQGVPAEEAVRRLTEPDEDREHRALGIGGRAGGRRAGGGRCRGASWPRWNRGRPKVATAAGSNPRHSTWSRTRGATAASS